jgi:hypothetical protein
MSVNTMPIHKDRRRFDRHSIDFRVEIISRDRQGRDHKEMTTLGEVSGEGARFFTENAERYFVEQSLEVSIFLPGTDEVQATMKGTAKVIWIGPCSNAASRGKAQPVCVAIKLDAPLFFERYSAR